MDGAGLRDYQLCDRGFGPPRIVGLILAESAAASLVLGEKKRKQRVVSPQ